MGSDLVQRGCRYCNPMWIDHDESFRRLERERNPVYDHPRPRPAPFVPLEKIVDAARSALHILTVSPTRVGDDE